MKKALALFCSISLLVTLAACGQNAQGNVSENTAIGTTEQPGRPIESAPPTADAPENTPSTIPGSQEEAVLQIQVEAEGVTILFELNDSRAARELYEQLPLTIEVENYSTNEKIFYPPRTLDVSDAPQADTQVGTLAYYAPWGDVVMFYGDFHTASGLYELGQAISGSEYISGLSGTIQVEAVDA